jgi:tetratricopeptide (TPR) repeat protein
MKFAEAEYLAAQQKYIQAIAIYKQIASDPNAFILKNISGLRQAQMSVAVDDFVSAITLLQAIADEDEKNIYADKALYLLARIYQFGLKDMQKAEESYEKLLAKFPSSLYLDEVRVEILKLKEKLS